MYLSTNPNVEMLNKDGTKLVTVLDPESESYKSLGKAEGALFGFSAAGITCLLPFLFKNSWSADTLVTKRFIQENSEKEVVLE